MKRILGSMMLGTFLLFAPPAQAVTEAIVTAPLNFRDGPSTAYPIRGKIAAGEMVTVRNCNGNWCQINYGPRIGWASASYLAFRNGDAVYNSYNVPSSSTFNVIIGDGYVDDWYWRHHNNGPRPPWWHGGHRPPPPPPPPNWGGHRPPPPPPPPPNWGGHRPPPPPPNWGGNRPPPNWDGNRPPWRPGADMPPQGGRPPQWSPGPLPGGGEGRPFPGGGGSWHGGPRD
ncbi:SH3 domain-containing protein [uncultured Bartonella sp.]|uniref:SH3 domain-containing protein n=1 Tax=uncultured Bartonella sp. TaxID=104108 RepID=UPI00261CED8A|nr:SH3 domain-containing protein [uncultured Bartonella sp.]